MALELPQGSARIKTDASEKINALGNLKKEAQPKSGNASIHQGPRPGAQVQEPSYAELVASNNAMIEKMDKVLDRFAKISKQLAELTTKFGTIG